MTHRTNYDFKIESMRDFLPPSASDFVVEGLLLAREVSLFYGPSNVGKTALVVQGAKRIVCGEAVEGRGVRQGAVFYVAAESPHSVKSRAFAALGPARPEGELFHVVEGQPNLCDPTYVTAFVNVLKAQPVTRDLSTALLVFDTTVLSIGAGDENSNSDMTHAIAGARQIAEALNCHVMLGHHAGKDVERGARGASALRANVDTELCCSIDDKTGGRIEQVKQRNIEKGSALGFCLRAVEIARDEKGRPITAVVADLGTTAQGKIDRQARAPSKELLGLVVETALLGLARTGLPVTTDQILVALPPRTFDRALEPSSHKRAVERACGELRANGVLRQTKEGSRNLWRILTPIEADAA